MIECVYDEVYRFSEKRAAVKQNGKWGFIDKWGNQIISLIYEAINSFSEGLACVYYDDKCGFIDILGDLRIPFIYGAGRSFVSGRAWVASQLEYEGHGGGFMSIDRLGKIIYPLKLHHKLFDSPRDFKNGMAVVETSNPIYCDETSSPFVYHYLSFDFETLWGTYEGGYEDAFDFKDGVACVKYNGKYGFVNTDFEEVIDFNYEQARPFGEGLAPVREGDRWSYINQYQDRVFSLGRDYDQCYEFSDGLARVNTMEEDIFDPPLNSGILYYGRPRVIIRRKYGFINSEGNLVIPCIFDNAQDFEKGIALVKRDGTFHYIDITGTEYYEK